MSKRIPLSRASKEFYKLLPKLRGVSAEADIADAHANLANPEDLRRVVVYMPSGAGLDPSFGFDENPFGLEYIWMARWAACKQVYRIDPVVAAALMSQPLEGKIPSAAIERLPYPIVYIDCPVDYSTGALDGLRVEQAHGFIAYVDTSPENRQRELNIVYLHKNPDGNGKTRHLVSIDLSFDTLDEALEDILEIEQALWDEGAQDLSLEDCPRGGEEERQAFKLTVGQALNLLLYVVAQENDAEVVYEPPRGTLRGQKAGKRTNPETITELGARIGRRIGEARKAFPSGDLASASPSNRTVAPHIRRAHWQTYWVGPRKGRTDGRKGDKVIVKWISPIEVNGGGAGAEVVHDG